MRGQVKVVSAPIVPGKLGIATFDIRGLKQPIRRQPDKTFSAPFLSLRRLGSRRNRVLVPVPVAEPLLREAEVGELV